MRSEVSDSSHAEGFLVCEFPHTFEGEYQQRADILGGEWCIKQPELLY